MSGHYLVVTTFHCRTLRSFLLVWALHKRIRRTVHKGARGLVSSALDVDWRRRQIRNYSLWKSLADIASMGQVRAHINAAHVPQEIQVQTECVLYESIGDWRPHIFGEGGLLDIHSQHEQQGQYRREDED